tara:strand:+ start:227 stop:508 length:282 start_codon:yes stop_codon:yes gene_type:complete
MIIWLSSYLKGGNTWLKSIISSLINTDDGNFNFKLLDRIPLFTMRRHLQDSNKNFNNFKEGVYDNAKSKKVKFFFKGPENNWKVSLEENLIQR